MNAPFDLTKAMAVDPASPDTALVIANVSRRKFLQGASALGGLVLAVGYPEALRAADPPKYGADGMPHGWVDNPLVFVAIGEDGIVSIVCHRSEMGQGVRTGMPMIVADELEADWARVRVVQAPGMRSATATRTPTARAARAISSCPCAVAAPPRGRCWKRPLLRSWKVPVSEVQAKNNEVVHVPTGRRLGYGALAKAAASMPLPAMDTIRLKDPSQFRYIGTGKLKLVDAQDIVTGKTHYGMDTRLPGMLYAVVARPQVYGGKVMSVDSAAALKVPGVVKVVQIDATPGAPQFNPLGGVAVIARNTWAAMQGRNALKIVWDDGPNASYDSVAYRATLEEAARKPGPGRPQRRGLHRSGGRCGETHHRGILSSASRARIDGTAGGERSHYARQMRSLGLLPVTAGRARPGRQAARHDGRQCHRACHVARRRIWAQVQARLRHRGGRAVQGDGRQAGQGRLDA